MQKSRKALRLYTSVERIGVANAEFRELQAQEWKEVNADLLRQISHALETGSSKALVSDIFTLRDRFYSNWRGAEKEVHQKQRDLIMAAENGDFVKAAILGRELVLLKAREQASQAAHHELHEVLARSKVQAPTIELSSESMLEEESEAMRPQAKVIPLRGR
ncbi:MAG: hypothetical protein K1X79_14295 [Oligoflexia bacterium]|nr:hypothetical protein [Oligoflexia bacterium]